MGFYGVFDAIWMLLNGMLWAMGFHGVFDWILLGDLMGVVTGYSITNQLDNYDSWV